MDNALFPMPDRLSDWDNQTKIIYRCPSCSTSFDYYCKDERFCHHCGQKINWTGLPEYCDEDTSAQYFDFDDQFCRGEMNCDVASFHKRALLDAFVQNHRNGVVDNV